MSVTLRIILIISSILSFVLCVRKIKKSELKIENSIIWLLGSMLLILMSIFSKAVTWISTQLGFEAPVNFVWMCAIGFLLIELFLDNIRISNLNEKIKNLNHYIALKENEEKKGNE
ncbi:MAG: DUF2304 domain-containing protein [Clostridia bacterium]|nr:DUF2304 domain-containing protein [Clostridia bacterium]